MGKAQSRIFDQAGKVRYDFHQLNSLALDMIKLYNTPASIEWSAGRKAL
jgi:hypothetical protein